MVIVGKVEGVNTSDGIINIVVTDKEKHTHNIKCSSEYKGLISTNIIYKFNCKSVPGKLILESLEQLEVLSEEEIISLMNDFDNVSPLSYDYSVKKIDEYISKIENKIIYDITKNLVKKYNKEFYTYPAAIKMHHAYAGGLAHHTIGMLNMVDSFIENYPYLNKDYLYAGIILHDIGKTREFSGIQNPDYSPEGQLIGHLVIGGLEVFEMAKDLGYDKTEEVMLLEHILISHHGVPQYGACKKPMTAEALVVWYIDTIDSKFRVLGDELEKTAPGTFTDQIGVLDRTKIYKPKK